MRPNRNTTALILSRGLGGRVMPGVMRLDIMRLALNLLTKNAPPGIRWHYEKMPDEHHSTIYQPAALKAFRAVFKPNTNERK